MPPLTNNIGTQGNYMALFTSMERKNGYSSTSYKLPVLTTFEKKVRRIEVLLLDNPHGCFKSSIQSYASATSEETNEILTILDAKELDGFWVHPHFYYNVRADGTKFEANTQTESTASKVIALISIDPLIPVHKLMRQADIYDPKDLVTALRMQTSHEIHKQIQHIASCFLYRHFNIRHIVHKL